jgi:hypothetical protein
MQLDLHSRIEPRWHGEGSRLGYVRSVSECGTRKKERLAIPLIWYLILNSIAE